VEWTSGRPPADDVRLTKKGSVDVEEHTASAMAKGGREGLGGGREGANARGERAEK